MYLHTNKPILKNTTAEKTVAGIFVNVVFNPGMIQNFSNTYTYSYILQAIQACINKLYMRLNNI